MKRRALNNFLVFLVGASTAFLCSIYKRQNRKGKETDKYFQYYDVLNRWMKQKERGISITEKLQRQGIKEVAIYGMGDLGQHLLYELTNTDIVIKYAIDRSFFAVGDLDIYLPDSELPQVDAVIVTPILDYESICDCLREKLTCPILSIADLFIGDEVGK